MVKPRRDLALVVVAALAACLFAALLPSSLAGLRAPLSLPLVLLLPGYAVVSAIFRPGELRTAELITLSIAVSIAATLIVALALDVPMALLTIVDSDRIWFKSKVGIEGDGMAREQGLCDDVLSQDRAFVVGDALADPRTRSHPLVTGPFGLRAYCGAALRTPGGEAVGTLCAMDRVPRAFDARQVTIVEEMAELIVAELEMRLALRHIKAESRLRRIAESQR